MDDKSLRLLFSPLLTRLFRLDFLVDRFFFDEIPLHMESVDEIVGAIFSYPIPDSMRMIEVCLTLITALEQQGKSIVSSVVILSNETYEDKPEEFIPASNEQEEDAKETLYSFITTELSFYKTKLETARERLLKIDFEVTHKNTPGVVIQFDSKKEFPKRLAKLRESELTVKQTTLLFEYLKESKIILDLDQTTFAKLISLLTGVSFNTVRQDYLPYIWDIKRGQHSTKDRTRPKKVSNFELEAIQRVLHNLLNIISKDIEYNNSKKL